MIYRCCLVCKRLSKTNEQRNTSISELVLSVVARARPSSNIKSKNQYIYIYYTNFVWFVNGYSKAEETSYFDNRVMVGSGRARATIIKLKDLGGPLVWWWSRARPSSSWRTLEDRWFDGCRARARPIIKLKDLGGPLVWWWSRATITLTYPLTYILAYLFTDLRTYCLMTYLLTYLLTHILIYLLTYLLYLLT